MRALLRALATVVVGFALTQPVALANLVQYGTAGGGVADCSNSGPIAKTQTFCADNVGCAQWSWGSYGTTNTSASITLSSATNQVCVLYVPTYQGETITGAVWNGSEAFTFIDRQPGSVEGQAQNTEAWIIVNPTPGTHTFAVTFNSAPAFSSALMDCYSGVDQTTPVNHHNKGVNNSNATSFGLGATATGGNNCWATGAVFVRNSGTPNSVTGASGTTVRQAQGDAIVAADSGGTVTAGTATLNYNYGGTGNTTPGAITLTLNPAP